MTLDLSKGERINLAQKAPGTRFFSVGIGWDQSNPPIDLDVSAAACKYDANGDPKLVAGKDSFLYFGTQGKNIGNGAVVHSGDNLTGAGDGDDETIFLDLDKCEAAGYEEIAIILNVYNGKQNGTKFGTVKKPHANIYEGNSVQNPSLPKLATFSPADDFSMDMAIQLGSFYQKDGVWRWNSIGKGFQNVDLNDFFNYFGG